MTGATTVKGTAHLTGVTPASCTVNEITWVPIPTSVPAGGVCEQLTTMIEGGGWMLLRRQLVMTAHKSGTVAWQLVTVMPGSLARQAQSRINWALAGVAVARARKLASNAAIKTANFVFIIEMSMGQRRCVWNSAVFTSLRTKKREKNVQRYKNFPDGVPQTPRPRPFLTVSG